MLCSLSQPAQLKRLGRCARHQRPTVVHHATAAETATSQDAQMAKCALLEAVENTNRGSRASRARRGEIEELQVAVESFQSGQDLDYEKLGGMWLLRYTTAADVLPILEADVAFANPLGLPGPVSIGNIYQRFTSPVDGAGKVDNVIRFSVPYLLEDREGVTVTVEASYEVRSGHRIALTFDAAQVGDVKISEGLEAVIAPALLPRTPLQGLLLQSIKQFTLRLPFRSAAQVAAGLATGNSRQAAGGSYQLTYLDEDMLIGRAVALGGTFVFTREA